MAVKSLGQITRELGNVYNPQVDLIRQRQSAIPNTIKQEEQGLQAKQEQSFGDILSGARRRGLGFSGIPLQEQAKYTSTEFLPALARLRQSGQEQANSLEEAILGIRERQTGMASQMREGMLSRDMALKQMAEDRRRFDLQMAESRRASAAAAGGGFSPSLGQAPRAAAQKKTDPLQQAAYNDVFTRYNSGNTDQDLKNDYLATASSAKYGNKRDLYKLQVYRQLRPDLFKNKYSWER